MTNSPDANGGITNQLRRRERTQPQEHALIPLSYFAAFQCQVC